MFHLKLPRPPRFHSPFHLFLEKDIHFFLVLAVWVMAVLVLVLALCFPALALG